MSRLEQEEEKVKMDLVHKENELLKMTTINQEYEKYVAKLEQKLHEKPPV